jgi:hypothetical protein
MKNVLLSLGICLLAYTAGARSIHPDTAKASQCRASATEIAKMNMDQHAKKYAFDASEVMDAVFVESVVVKDEKFYKYDVEAYIYKGNYNVTVLVDASCAVSSVAINEVLRDATAVPE